jgi:altronate hydrolase
MSSVHFYDDLPQGVVPFDDVAVRLHPEDDVAIAKTNLPPGLILQMSDVQIRVSRLVPSGHKLALHEVPPGAPVRRYGEIIGVATQAILAGDHVHTHNLAAHGFDRPYTQEALSPVDIVPEGQQRTFYGYRRADGRVGTRNYIAVIATVNCASHTAREIARRFTPELRSAYPNVDGVIALAHTSGCANQINGTDYRLLQRTLAGMAKHPNVAAYVIVGLGCETNQISDLVAQYGLHSTPHLSIQETGGIRRTVEAGVQAIEALLPAANAARRTPQPVSKLVLALQCGGSDGWSGVTANPALGLTVDVLVRQGATAVLAETPEIYGAEHLLIRRAASPEVAEKLLAKVHWWEEHTRRLGIAIDNNPSVGNKVGGLTTIYEKSLGAITKGGSTPLIDVYDYAEPVNACGLTFMDTPGYDPVAVTGQVAGGCTLVLFTTGRGSVFGFRPAPTIKISTNTQTYQHMIDDMDINAGRIIEGASLHDIATEIMERVITVASGEPSKSEAQGVGEAEFNPWNLGGTL